MFTPFMNKFQQLFLIPAILLTLVGCSTTPSNHSNSSTQRHIYILKSSGICGGCAEAVSKLLFTAGIQSQIIGPEQLKATVQPQDMIIVGGTAEDNEDGELTLKQDLVKADAFDWLKQHIANGGRYVGICGGAYLPEKWIDEKGGERGLDIFPGEINNYSKTTAARMVKIDCVQPSQNRWVYFQDGPAFYPKEDSNISVLARFSKDRVAAAVIFPYGKGKVGLISPHFEADEGWLKVDHLNDPDGLDYDLGISFIRQALQ
jgi:imidazoleglycerol phosphate synthase glutamine amidotransferase subunit HisH